MKRTKSAFSGLLVFKIGLQNLLRNISRKINSVGKLILKQVRSFTRKMYDVPKLLQYSIKSYDHSHDKALLYGKRLLEVF
jgi:hypothetical protein